MSAKIVPFGGKFTDFRAMLAAIAEDKNAIGFVGCVLRLDETGRHLRRVNFECTVAEAALAGAMMMQMALEDPE